ncbi:unnamed protein product [Adineta ricciae]|uniref:Uncharacterized protein n=1 Tax=Adineta ricciae TaxID=249248 RepID=A0A813XG32_ADIRI|nr:unnamed protein product [Adineta ricciae]
MADAPVYIVSLCDELLLTIYNRPDNVNVLYSLIGVSRKIDELVGGITFTQYVGPSRINFKKKSILDRFCLDLLPRVRHNNQSLTLNVSLIDHVFRIGYYSELHKLALLNDQWYVI